MDTPRRQAEAGGVGPWLRRLHDCAVEWARRAPAVEGAQTEAYVALMFAFGLARLGERAVARELLKQGQAALAPRDEAHRLLLAAFEYRIGQALEGKPHTGPLPPELMERIQGLGDCAEERMLRYAVDRMRERSRILEPVLKVDAYERYTIRASELNAALAELMETNDRERLADGLRRLLRDTPSGERGEDPKLRVLTAGLDAAPRIDEEFACGLLDRALAVYDALPQQRVQRDELRDRALLLEKGWTAADHFKRVDFISPLTDRLAQLLRSPAPSGDKCESLARLIGHALRSLRRLGLRDQAESLAAQVVDSLGLQCLEADLLPRSSAGLQILLHLAAVRYWLRRNSEAEPILETVRGVLFKGDLTLIRRAHELKFSLPLILSCAATLGQAPAEEAQRRLEELFARLPGLWDGWQTAPWYSLSQLEVVEAVVWAVVDDDATLGPGSRR
jgi:hypothetical protein